MDQQSTTLPGHTTPIEHPNLTPEDLRCPHCGYGVFGLPQERCPECGGQFSWEDVHIVAQASRLKLFEYRWQDQPLRSIVRTWLLAVFKPWQLWRLYDARDMPKLVPLLILIAIQLCLFYRGYQLLAMIIDPVMNWASQMLAIPPRAPMNFVYRLRLNPDMMAGIAVWYIATFVTLLLFFESPKAAGPRWRHILRIYVHSTMLASVSMIVWCVAEWIIDLSLLIEPKRLSTAVYDDVGYAIMLFGLVVTWLSIWIGYRRYLDMPFGWAVACLSLFMGRLAADAAIYYLI